MKSPNLNFQMNTLSQIQCPILLSERLEKPNVLGKVKQTVLSEIYVFSTSGGHLANTDLPLEVHHNTKMGLFKCED